MTVTVLDSVDTIKGLVGTHLGYSSYVLLDQARVDMFAEATGDKQWIHVDVERAKAGPYGSTVAHGMLSLGILSVVGKEIFTFKNFKMGLNYGYDRIRFPSVIKIPSKVRGGVKVLACEDVPGGIQTTFEFTIEVEGATKPACVAHMLMRHIV